MLPMKTQHRIELDRMWRSPEWRARFELEMKFKPLAVDDKTKNQENLAGITKAYHDAFNEWGRKILED